MPGNRREETAETLTSVRSEDPSGLTFPKESSLFVPFPSNGADHVMLEEFGDVVQSHIAFLILFSSGLIIESRVVLCQCSQG